MDFPGELRFARPAFPCNQDIESVLRSLIRQVFRFCDLRTAADKAFKGIRGKSPFALSRARAAVLFFDLPDDLVSVRKQPFPVLHAPEDEKNAFGCALILPWRDGAHKRPFVDLMYLPFDRWRRAVQNCEYPVRKFGLIEEIKKIFPGDIDRNPMIFTGFKTAAAQQGADFLMTGAVSPRLKEFHLAAALIDDHNMPNR